MRSSFSENDSEKEVAKNGFKQGFNVFHTWHFASSAFAIGFLKGLYTLLFALIGYVLMIIGIFLIIAKAMLAGLILLIAGIIYLIVIAIYKNIQYSQAQFIYRDNDEQISYNEAIKDSIKLMEGHCGEFFWLNITFLPWYILSYLTCGLVGFFYVTPYANLTFADYYIKLTQLKDNSDEKD